MTNEHNYRIEGSQIAIGDLLDMSYDHCLGKAEDLLSTAENEREGDVIFAALVDAYVDTILSFESIPAKPFYINPNWSN